MLRDYRQITFVMLNGFCLLSNPPPSLPTLACPYIIANINGKPLAAIGKFPSVIGKLMIGKALSTNGGKLPML